VGKDEDRRKKGITKLDIQNSSLFFLFNSYIFLMNWRESTNLKRNENEEIFADNLLLSSW